MLVFIIVMVITVVSAMTDIRDSGILTLVFGGKRTPIEDAPFVALFITKSHDFQLSCGASILTEKFVLSAAHCYSKSARRYYVRVGADRIGKGRVFNVEKMTVHPQYNSETIDYDILVIKLVSKLKFSAKTQSVKMADSELVIKDGAILETYGFGITENGRTSKYLRGVKVPYVNREKCKSAYQYSEITDRMICAGEQGKDSCQGDSGGPLIYDNVLVGVVSFGGKCGHPSVPGVYASVARVRKFIDGVINSM